MRVLVKKYGTNKIVKELVVSSERKAEKVLAGLNINLNHEEYYVEVEKNDEVAK